MKVRSRQNRTGDVATVGIFLTVALALLALNSRASAKPHAVDRALLVLIASIQNTFTRTADGVVSFWTNYVYHVNLAEENQKLKEENLALKTDNARLALLEGELDRLQGLLDFRRENPEYLPARIIGRDTTAAFRTLMLRIDRGDQEVKKGMAVVTPEGIVGQIFQVFGDYADVMLLVDPRSRIDVLVERSRSPGTLQGKGDEEDYLCTIPLLSRDDTIREGDLIVTSGLDQLFPKGLPVGTVTQITPHKDQPYQEVEVRPVIDLSRIEYVFVVPSASPKSSSVEAAEGKEGK